LDGVLLPLKTLRGDNRVCGGQVRRVGFHVLQLLNGFLILRFDGDGMSLLRRGDRRRRR
jgi:hypothetical protein